MRFRLGGREYGVREMLDRWFGRDADFYKVLADDGNLHILRAEPGSTGPVWNLESFRDPGRGD